MDNERKNLLARQWCGYRRVHSERKNLVIHGLTVPVFMLGTLAVLGSVPVAILVSGWSALVPAVGGLVAMMTAVALQGAGHRRESQRPEPFAGPGEVVARIFLEQWVTFPRYVLRGEFTRALRSP
jgi:hypothetical protein